MSGRAVIAAAGMVIASAVGGGGVAVATGFHDVSGLAVLRGLIEFSSSECKR